jgi:hypothetical protein
VRVRPASPAVHISAVLLAASLGVLGWAAAHEVVHGSHAWSTGRHGHDFTQFLVAGAVLGTVVALLALAWSSARGASATLAPAALASGSRRWWPLTLLLPCVGYAAVELVGAVPAGTEHWLGLSVGVLAQLLMALIVRSTSRCLVQAIQGGLRSLRAVRPGCPGLPPAPRQVAAPRLQPMAGLSAGRAPPLP